MQALQRKPRILAFADWYLPGYRAGGPIRTLSNLIGQLGDEMDFHVVTRDRDYFVDTPYSGVATDRWVENGKARVRYLAPGSQRPAVIRRLFLEGRFDVLYLNSVYSPRFSIQVALMRRFGWIRPPKTVIAARGEMAGSARGLKAYKKVPFLRVARLMNLYRGVVWQASSEFEMADIRHVMGRDATVCVAPNVPPAPPELSEEQMLRRRTGDTLRLVFLGRIARVKNLHYCFDVLDRVRVPVVFDIYGPVAEDDYWEECRRRMEALPSHVRSEYKGPVVHEETTRSLLDYDLFFLPTTGENFGHAVLEAMLTGLPVLISDQTPWKRLQHHGVGWDLPLNRADEFAAVIDRCGRMTPEDHRKMVLTTRAYAVEHCRSSPAIEQNRLLLAP